MIERRARTTGWRNLAAMLACAALSLSLMAQGAALDPPGEQPVASTKETSMPSHAQALPRLKLGFAGGEAVVELNDNAVTRDLMSMLPLTLQFSDYNRVEKIAYPPRKLKTTAAPFGLNPPSAILRFMRHGAIWWCTTANSKAPATWCTWAALSQGLSSLRQWTGNSASLCKPLIDRCRPDTGAATVGLSALRVSLLNHRPPLLHAWPFLHTRMPGF